MKVYNMYSIYTVYFIYCILYMLYTLCTQFLSTAEAHRELDRYWMGELPPQGAALSADAPHTPVPLRALPG